jgi:hypothetical protein
MGLSKARFERYCLIQCGSCLNTPQLDKFRELLTPNPFSGALQQPHVTFAKY